MFQYTNTIVLNSLKDVTTGLDKFVERTIDGQPALDVRRVNLFKKPNVSKMYKRAASDPVIGNVSFKMAQQDAGIYRIKLYMRLSGSQNSYYANDFVFKGKPLVYEFRIASNSTTGANVAAEAKRVIDKIQTLYGDKWIKTRVDDDVLTISGTDEYQLFTEAKLQKLNASANSALTNEVFEDIAEGTIVPCREGFGTYTHILKDLRLPTIESRRFEAVNQEELPIPGMKYNQYTIYYKVDRGLFGGAALGQQVTSVTTHVFYVLESISDAFETMIKKLGTLTEEEKPIKIESGVDDQGTTTNTGQTHTITPTLKDVNPATTDDSTLVWADAQTDANWITVIPSASNVQLKAGNNDSGAERSATVNVKVKNKAGAVASKNIKVTQQNE
jgi:hypothetical protein